MPCLANRVRGHSPAVFSGHHLLDTLWILSNATLSRRHLSVRIFCLILFSMLGVHLRKENCAFTLKQHLIFLHGETVKMLAQGFFDFSLDAAALRWAKSRDPNRESLAI